MYVVLPKHMALAGSSALPGQQKKTLLLTCMTKVATSIGSADSDLFIIVLPLLTIAFTDASGFAVLGSFGDFDPFAGLVPAYEIPPYFPPYPPPPPPFRSMCMLFADPPMYVPQAAPVVIGGAIIITVDLVRMVDAVVVRSPCTLRFQLTANGLGMLGGVAIRRSATRAFANRFILVA